MNTGKGIEIAIIKHDDIICCLNLCHILCKIDKSGVIYVSIIFLFSIMLGTSLCLIYVSLELSCMYYKSTFVFMYFSVSGELVNNSCGLGFNGYDENGKAKWDLLNNVLIYQLEVNVLQI